MSHVLSNLLSAVCKGDLNQVRANLSRGNVDFCDPVEGLTLLSWAVSNDHVEVAREMLKWEANVEVADNEGFTPLHRASWRGSTAMVNLLLTHGANVDARSNSGRTPLILASMRGDVDVVLALCENGSADEETKDQDGLTPIVHAALRGKDAVVRALMQRGVDCTDARLVCDAAADRAQTIPERDSYNNIARELCAVWTQQSLVGVS